MNVPISIAQESIDKLAHALSLAIKGQPLPPVTGEDFPPIKKGKEKNKKAPDLVELSGIAPLLVTAAGAHGRTVETKKSVDACTKAFSKVQEKLSSDEKAMLEKFITTPGFKVFAGAWQKWHDQASKEAFGG